MLRIFCDACSAEVKIWLARHDHIEANGTRYDLCERCQDVADEILRERADFNLVREIQLRLRGSYE